MLVFLIPPPNIFIFIPIGCCCCWFIKDWLCLGGNWGLSKFKCLWKFCPSKFWPAPPKKFCSANPWDPGVNRFETRSSLAGVERLEGLLWWEEADCCKTLCERWWPGEWRLVLNMSLNVVDSRERLAREFVKGRMI